MGKPKYDPPTATFPYKISHRLQLLSVPRKYIIVDTGEGMPAYSPRGIRMSALRSHISDRVNDAAWPYIRRFLLTKKMYKNKFKPQRIENIDRMIESANATCYSKLANCVLDLKSKQGGKDVKKKRGWTETDWKKHMDYLSPLAEPKKDFRPPPIERGGGLPIAQLLPRLQELASLPEFKVYRRQSQEAWYRDPVKVRRGALKYVISDRVKKLALPKKQPETD